jgi:hypothetical protein
LIDNNTPKEAIPITIAHRRVFEAYSFSMGAIAITFWLYDRAEPGTIQEIRYVDYCAYCDANGLNRLSKEWFYRNLTQMFLSPLFELVAKTKRRRLGLESEIKAIAYQPWQLTDWSPEMGIPELPVVEKNIQSLPALNLPKRKEKAISRKRVQRAKRNKNKKNPPQPLIKEKHE